MIRARWVSAASGAEIRFVYIPDGILVRTRFESCGECKAHKTGIERDGLIFSVCETCGAWVGVRFPGNQDGGPCIKGEIGKSITNHIRAKWLRSRGWAW